MTQIFREGTQVYIHRIFESFRYVQCPKSSEIQSGCTLDAKSLQTDLRKHSAANLFKERKGPESDGSVALKRWPGSDDCDRSLRLGPQIPINALQSRLAGFQPSRSEPSPGIDSRRLGAKILSENARENAKFRRSHI